MSSTLPADAALRATLADLRGEIDRIDDAIHDLLMRRGETVERLAAIAVKNGVPMRPGREADIIRRLLDRHRGALPRRLLVRWWRELFAATTAVQSSYVVTVCDTDPAAGFVQCAREHFGALTALHVHRSPAQALREVSAGTAIAAVLPMPVEEEPDGAAWWTALLHHDQPRIHVVARLPFWAPRAEGAPRVQALVVAALAPDPSARDRSLIGLELSAETSRARLAGALAAAGLPAGTTLLRRAHGGAQALVEVDGLIADDDARLRTIAEALRRPVVLGAYAVPVEGETA
jgi:chorismate mutase/prephenate dehydratase